jgi:hypothetical protein
MTKEKKIALVFGGVAALAGVTAFFLFFPRRKNAKSQAEIMALDKEIKLLQLEKLREAS